MNNHLKRRGLRSTRLPVEVPVLVVFGVVLLGAAPAPAKEVFTADHVAKLRSVSTAKVSPDGRHIAYVLSVPRRPYKDENGPSWSQLHVIGPDGTSRPYITGEGNVGAIQWPPDGHGISFLAKRGKDKHRALYVIPLSGGEARKILSHKTDITSYSFNPDGSRVALVSDRDGSDGNVFVLKLATGQITQVTREAWAARPAWSPDGQSIVYLSLVREVLGVTPLPNHSIPDTVPARVRRVAVNGGQPETIFAAPKLYRSIN